MAPDTDSTPLVSHAEPPAQINVPGGPLSLKLSEKARREEAETDAAKQPMLSTSTPTPPGQPDPEKGADPEKGPDGPPPPYSAFVPWRRRFILIVITVAGFFGPLAGGIYLPALPVLEQEFQASATAINITVSVFMLTFAFGVSNATPYQSPFTVLSNERLVLASVLVELCGLEGASAFISNFYRHLYRLQHLARRGSSQLRRVGLFTDRASLWLFCCCLHGSRLSC